MQIRKLVKSGLSSYTIALPKDWIERNKLGKGDLLYVDDEDNRIVISSRLLKDRSGGDDLVINTEGKNLKVIKWEICSAYLNNYNRIFIKGENLTSMVKEIKVQIHDLVSLEVIEETNDKIIARSFLDFSDVGVNDLLRRVDNIIRSMYTDCTSLITDYSEEYDLAQIIIDRDGDVNRLSFMLFKIIKAGAKNVTVANKLGLTNVDLLKYWNLVFIMEKMADSLKRIARGIRELHEKRMKLNKKELARLFIEVKENYEDAMKAFYKNDLPLSNAVSLKKSSLMAKCDNYFSTNKALETAEIVGKLKSIISKTNDIIKILRF